MKGTPMNMVKNIKSSIFPLSVLARFAIGRAPLMQEVERLLINIEIMFVVNKTANIQLIRGIGNGIFKA